MSESADRIEVARGWWLHAVEALKAAEHDAMMFPSAAVNRAYYACFYAASAVLQSEGRHFVKHTGVRAAVHAELVKPGRLPREIGETYDLLLKTAPDRGLRRADSGLDGRSPRGDSCCHSGRRSLGATASAGAPRALRRPTPSSP
jgi:hypothetical protein